MSTFMPGPWKVGYRGLDVVAPSLRGGEAKVCDIRGWGYLTGKGHGALGLSEDEATAIQTANARLIAASPDLLSALKDLLAEYVDVSLNGDGRAWVTESEPHVIAARAAIAKAENPT